MEKKKRRPLQKKTWCAKTFKHSSGPVICTLWIQHVCVYIFSHFFLFSGCCGMQILSHAWSKVRDMLQGSIRTERSISRKQNCSAHNSYWPSIPKPSLADCHISMEYAFSSSLGHSSVSPGHQLLSRAWYVVCLSCPIQFSPAFLFIYLCPISLLILPRQQRIASSRWWLSLNETAAVVGTAGFVSVNGPSACRTESAQLCSRFPVAGGHTLDLSPALPSNYLRPLWKKNSSHWFSTTRAIDPRGRSPLALLCVFQEGPATLEEKLKDKPGLW